MNWRNGRITVALLLLLATGCGTKYDPLDHGMTERQEKADREAMLALLYNEYMWYLECQKPGAINFGGSCISVTTTEAIYDHATGNPLHATTVPATAQLECRDPGRTGMAAAVGNAWYRVDAPMAELPAGAHAAWIARQDVIYDSSKNVTGIIPFTVSSGQHLICVVWRDRYIAYQAVDTL